MEIDFIGVGAQKAGTSWVYACLFEHTEVCIPVKEIHYFSRPRYEKGKEWYEAHFNRCSTEQKVGEFSTSYLYSTEAAERIATDYPEAKLIAILRHPIDRAYSQYGNAIKAGEITTDISFAEYVEDTPSCLEQGLYAQQLESYLNHFPREQILILLYEDIAKDPQAFMQKIYRHLGVDTTFIPPSLTARINVARVPKATQVDTFMHKTAEFLRRYGFGRIVHAVKRSGVTDGIRRLNTDTTTPHTKPDLSSYHPYFTADVERLSTLLGQDMRQYWNL